MDRVSLPSPSPAPWDPGAAEPRASECRLAYLDSDSSSQADGLFGFADLGSGPGDLLGPWLVLLKVLRDTSGRKPQGFLIRKLGERNRLARLFWGREGQQPQLEGRNLGLQHTEPLVIWGRRGVDLTSCLNLALVEFFNRGFMTSSSLSQAFLTYSSNPIFPFGSNSASSPWSLTEGRSSVITVI